MTRTSGHPRLLTQDGVVLPEPVQFDDRLINEGFVQELIDENPGVLPIDEIGSSWGPLISLGREIGTTAGPIDNLLVSSTGELTVVEAKLWRNPESRRKVVGQVLDYASALSQLSYEGLDAAVSEGGGESIWDLVQAGSEVSPNDEASFIDTVSRNLQAGRFLLLVVGDGIREDIEGLADLIGDHPDLGFHLELVELKLYRVAEDLLVVPSLIGRTSELNRTVVEVRGDGQLRVSVDRAEAESSTKSRSRPLRSLEAFVELAEPEIGIERALATVEFARSWGRDDGRTKLNSRSINFSASFRHAKGGEASLFTVYTDGTAEFSAAPLSVWKSILTPEHAAELAAEHGFDRGSPRWPKRDLDLTDSETVALMRSLLERLSESVRAEDDRLDAENEDAQ